MQAVGVSLSALMLVGTVLAQDVLPPEELVEAPKKEYSPFVNDHFPTRPLFGDSHLHTSWSGDAGMLGGKLGPDEAYRSARGETVTSKDGWLDADGNAQEKVHDVAWSGGREPDANGKLPSVGSTVDVAKATWTNTIGAPELITVWADPDFDPDQRAFYYVRVIEIPTPRWSAYDAVRYDTEMSDDVVMTTTERAYTSPIWYTP